MESNDAESEVLDFPSEERKLGHKQTNPNKQKLKKYESFVSEKEEEFKKMQEEAEKQFAEQIASASGSGSQKSSSCCSFSTISLSLMSSPDKKEKKHDPNCPI